MGNMRNFALASFTNVKCNFHCPHVQFMYVCDVYVMYPFGKFPFSSATEHEKNIVVYAYKRVECATAEAACEATGQRVRLSVKA